MERQRFSSQHISTKKTPEVFFRPFGLHDTSPFMSSLYEKVDKIGTPAAMAEIFRDSNLKINIIGDTTQWNRSGKAALLIGSHANGFERFPMLAVFGEMQREDVRFITMPFTPAAALGEKIDRKEVGYTLEVIPAPLAKDRRGRFDEFLPLRLLHRNELLTREEGKSVTMKTLADSATLLEEGYAINIFPTGNVRYGMETPWRPGIGEVIRQVSREKRKDIVIVPYQFDADFTRSKLMKAVFYKNHGWNMREEPITLHIGQQVSASAIMGSERDPKAITKALQDNYLQSFAK